MANPSSASVDATIPWARPAIDDAELREVVACMESGWLSSGPRVEAFEQKLAARAGRKFGVAVSNGTAALDVALRALGVGPGDEVIVPAFSYVATASMVALVGATPVFADIDPRCFGISPTDASAKITSRTRAILSTDYGGNPCDLPALTDLCAQHGLALLHDGAQSLGAEIAGKPALSFGDLSTVSFHAAKTMTSIEGGMVFTDDPAAASRLRILRSQGEDPQQKYVHIALGHNFRMTELQAAIGLAQERKLDALLVDRQRACMRYHSEFAALGLPTVGSLPDAHNPHFLYTLLVEDRDRVMRDLASRGVQCRACYPMPLYRQPIFQHLRVERCEVAEDVSTRVLNPPLFFGITPSQQRRVAMELQNVLSPASQRLAA